jgi:glyoxylase-like metal-dependent hydrolase (beta-lactamase superfamily II)
MEVDIFQIQLGFDQCYVLKSEGVIAVDAGAPNKGRVFVRGLERASIHPQDVQLIVITHGHWDHVGSAGEIKAITGAKLAMHRRARIYQLTQEVHATHQHSTGKSRCGPRR